MKLTIYRNDGQKEWFDEFEIAIEGNKTLLFLLKELKSTQDPTLSFRHSCSSGICGACALKVNGKPILACTYKPNGENLKLEPLEGLKVIKDLVVDESAFRKKIKTSKNFLTPKNQKTLLNQDDMKKITLQASCIECASCYSICPVTKVNQEFLGPFILTKTLRYALDKRESDEKSKIDAIQSNGVWDCILCGDCATVCPQGINSKMDISILQTKSLHFGYQNPHFAQFSFGFGGFNSF